MSQKLHDQTLQNFCYMLTVNMAQSFSDKNVIHYVLLVLWMTSCLATVSKAKVMPIGLIFKATYQRAAPPAEFDVCNCIVVQEIERMNEENNRLQERLKQIENQVVCLLMYALYVDSLFKTSGIFL